MTIQVLVPLPISSEIYWFFSRFRNFLFLPFFQPVPIFTDFYWFVAVFCVKFVSDFCLQNKEEAPSSGCFSYNLNLLSTSLVLLLDTCHYVTNDV